MPHKTPGNSPFNNRHYHHVGVIVKDMEKTIAFLTSLAIGPFGMPGGKKWLISSILSRMASAVSKALAPAAWRTASTAAGWPL